MIHRTLLSILLSCAAVHLAQADPPVDPNVLRKTDDAIRNWRAVKPDLLNDPSNAEVVKRLRKQAEGRLGDGRARSLLLRINDAPTISWRLQEFKSPALSRDLGADIVESGNAKLILVLTEPLLQEESADIVKFADGDEAGRLLPLSVRAAFAIRGLIRSSGAFSPAVTQWAQDLKMIGTPNAERTRSQIRAWVTANRAALERGQYAVTKVP